MTEMTEMRKFYANGVALVETQAMQLANQQGSTSDLLDWSSHAQTPLSRGTGHFP